MCDWDQRSVLMASETVDGRHDCLISSLIEAVGSSGVVLNCVIQRSVSMILCPYFIKLHKNLQHSM